MVWFKNKSINGWWLVVPPSMETSIYWEYSSQLTSSEVLKPPPSDVFDGLLSMPWSKIDSPDSYRWSFRWENTDGFRAIGMFPPIHGFFSWFFVKCSLVKWPFCQDGKDGGKLSLQSEAILEVYSSWLVVWNINFIFPYVGLLIIPIDELIFFRGVAQPPTSDVYNGGTPSHHPF